MDIHRCRFVPYPPHPINALSFSHPSDPSGTHPNPPDLRLALGRGNGDIEIWNPFGGDWFQETILRGGKDRSIEGLAWIQDPISDDGDAEADKRAGLQSGRLRLFSIGYSASVTEWDLALGMPARHANGNFGEIWCLAAQPSSLPLKKLGENKARESPSPPASQYLAAGCADGTIVLFSTQDNDLRFSKTLGKPPTKKPRILSIAWKDSNTIVAGYSDSTIRVYDIRKKTTIRNMSLGKPAERGNETLVWSVKCLPDGTIVSGDSTGELKIWDAKNYSLVQKLHTHLADILDIVTSASGDMIITGGADRRTIAYKLFGAKEGDRRQRWTKIMHRRFHQHDVKAMAAYESKDFSMVVSGGLDTVPIVIPFREWQNEYHRSLSNLPQKPQTSSSSISRFMMSWWDRELNVWHLPKSRHRADTLEDVYFEDQERSLVAKLLLSGDENITSAQISDDGRLIAIATVADVKLFTLRRRKEEGTMRMRTYRVELPPAVKGHGAKMVKLSPDGRWLCIVRPNNTIVMLKINTPTSSTTRHQVLPQSIKLNRPSRKSHKIRQPTSALGDYVKTVTSADFSADSRIIAVGDVSGFIDTWLLEGHEDLSGELRILSGSRSDEAPNDSSDSDSSDDDGDAIILQGQTWVRNPTPSALPQLNSPILILSFRSQPDETKQELANGNIGLHATRHNPHPHSHDLPTDEARLIAVTARHEILEFDVLQGRLSDWSRRNPPAYLPRKFTQVKDRAMGCFWDITGGQARVWLYGPTWLFVLDLSQDLPAMEPIGKLGRYEVVEPLGTSRQKRKRADSDDGKDAVRRNTGAGDAVQVSESGVGVGKRLRKFKGSSSGTEKAIEFQAGTIVLDEDGDEDPASGLQSNSSLALFRRVGDDDDDDDDDSRSNETDRLSANGHIGEPVVNGNSDKVASPEQEGRSSSLPTKQSKRGPAWWHTMHYRSVFGIVPIGRRRAATASGNGNDTGTEEGKEGSNEYDNENEPANAKQGEKRSNTDNLLEVAIVERPLWDIELPPRYDGGQDWEA